MSQLLKFKNQQQPFSIKSKSATKAEIIMYGAIGASWFEDSISAKSFSDELKKLDSTVNEITLRINSPGGDVFDGITIYNRLKQHPAKVKVIIDGLCASIASIIALAGDEVIMGEGSLYMVHLPWTGLYGNRIDFDNVSQRLMDIEEQMISIYVKKSKMSRTEMKALLEAETWLDADTAIEQGFVDSKIAESTPIAASVLDKATWLNKVPKNIVTTNVAAKKEILNLKSKIEGYLSRK